MKKHISLTIAIAFSVIGASQAYAQSTPTPNPTLTWVSGVGDDANPCSRTAPCKTFAGAISKTAAGGEISALDPGAYGAVTITKAITIDGGAGQVASIVVSGTNGVIIQAGVADAVTLRNISFQGALSGLSGIHFIAGGVLHVEHCLITQFTLHGIDIEPANTGAKVFVEDTISQDNIGDGLYAIGPGSPVQVTLDNSRFENNMNGVLAADFTQFSIRNSAAGGNSQAGFIALPNAGSAVVSIVNSTAGNNSVGIQSGGGSAAANVRVAGVSIFLNTTGFSPASNGTITSFGNNFNSGSGSPNASLPVQ